MALHESTFEYLKPTDHQIECMARVRKAAKEFCDVLERELPEGPDKTFTIRAHRSNAMWANVAITRHHDGTPRIGDTGHINYPGTSLQDPPSPNPPRPT